MNNIDDLNNDPILKQVPVANEYFTQNFIE
jgi:hypothetical protein